MVFVDFQLNTKAFLTNFGVLKFIKVDSVLILEKFLSTLSESNKF